MHFLGFAARHGKWCLILGLLAGMLLPGLAMALKDYLPVFIAGLLFLAALRIGPDAVRGGLQAARRTFWLVGIYQLAAPLAVFAVCWIFGVAHTPAALAFVLMLSAPSVTGGPNFAILMGLRPDSALRMLIVGTALLPLTAMLVLWLLPGMDIRAVLYSAARLVGVVLIATGLAFALRSTVMKSLSDKQRQGLDGASAILLGVVVVGLMSAVGPALTQDPARFAAWLGFAIAVNFGSQLLAWSALRTRVPEADRPAISIVAGNRNIALFLVALPSSMTDALLIFIGCYQIPMYLTPIVLRRVFSWKGSGASV